MNADLETHSAAPIRVLQFICPTGYYGAERWITALANNADPDTVTHDLAVTDEPDTDYLELCAAFEKMKLSVHRVPMNHRFDVRAIGRLAALMRRERIDVLHTHGYKSDLIGVAAARRAGVASVCTPHGFENARDLKLRAFVALGKRSFRFFDRVAPLSEPLRRDVAATGVPERRIRHIANGVDLKAIRETLARDAGSLPVPPRTYDDGGDGATIGFVGQLISRKNVGDLVDVFERLARERPDLRLVLVGDGEERVTLEQRIARSAHADRVEFRGFVRDAVPHYADFDLFVMTSSLEGIPRCLMEAMAIGVPIVAYDIPGVDQLVSDGRTGLLAPFGDKDALLARCERLLDDEGLAGELVDNARHDVNENFSAARMAREYEELYRELIPARSASLAGRSGP